MALLPQNVGTTYTFLLVLSVTSLQKIWILLQWCVVQAPWFYINFAKNSMKVIDTHLSMAYWIHNLKLFCWVDTNRRSSAPLSMAVAVFSISSSQLASALYISDVQLYTVCVYKLKNYLADIHGFSEDSASGTDPPSVVWNQLPHDQELVLLHLPMSSCRPGDLEMPFSRVRRIWWTSLSQVLERCIY